MKTITGLCAGFCLVFGSFGSGAMVAQDTSGAEMAPPKVLVIEREFTKPGKDGAVHEKSESAFVNAVTAAKWPTHYFAAKSMSGKPRVLFFFGKFGADEQVEAEEEDWVRAPEGLRLAEGMFVAHVEGRSMEPRIPDGSLNIFRGPVVGSRQGKIVLVELIGVHERFTVKRYNSRKSSASEDEWRHERVRLEPLNPDYEAFDLTPDQIKYVIAEWIQTLE